MRRPCLLVLLTLILGLAIAAQAAAADWPTNTAPPTLSGGKLYGNTLSATTGTWTGPGPITYAYRWYRCAAGATSLTGCTSLTGYGSANTYTLTKDDIHRRVAVVVQATNSAGSPTASSAPYGDIDTPCGIYCQTVSATSGLVDYWRLDDPSASGSGCAPSPTYDRKQAKVVGSACNNPGSYQVAGATSDDGGWGMAFDNYYGPGYFWLTAAPNLDLSGTKPYTFEFWVQPHEDYRLGTFVDAGDALNVYSDNYWGASGLQTTRAGSYQQGSLCAYRNVWGHVAITYDGATVKTYCNGTLYQSVASTTSVAAPDVRFFSAQAAFDELAVYDRALSASEITNHYAQR
jgi:hypothetical protein